MNTKLSVCMVGYGFHSPFTEGCAIIAKDLILALQSQLEISVVSVIDYFRGWRQEFGKDQLELNSWPSYYVDSNILFRWSKKYANKYLIINKFVDSVKILCTLRMLDSKYDTDIVHIFNFSHTLMSGMSKLLLHKKVVAHVVGLNAFELGEVLAKEFVDAYICTSEFCQSFLVRKGIPKEKIFVVPPIIDSRLYRPLDCLQEAPKKYFRITYVGHLYEGRLPQRALVQLAHLATSRPNIELLLCSPDTLQNRKTMNSLRTTISKFNIKYRFLVSNLSKQELVNIYNMSDLLVFPFTKEVTGMQVIDPPLTVLEAMACGKLILTSKVTSLPYIITDHQNGFLFNPDDYENFRNKMEYVIDNFSDLSHIASNARNTIQKDFSSNIVTNEVLNVYGKTMN